ncbi:MAG: Fe-S cluster assembly protein NifU [Pseudomonadota bacterium]
MWEYSDKVKEHFFNPRNAGAVEGANAIGEVGSISCGDALRLTLKVDPQSDTITDAGFQTFGCGSAIASSSALTEMVKGMSLEQALRISNQDIADYLDGLPAEKMHCSVMGREALAAAIANYRGEEWHDDHEEGALICKCFGIDEAMIEQTARANNLRTITDITNYTKAGGGCATCHEGIERVLARVWQEAPAEEGGVHLAEVVPCGGLTNLQRIRRIEQALDELRPMLRRDHGDVELVEVDGNTIYVNLIGACTGCMMAGATLGGIQQKLIEALGEVVRVVPASEMKRVAAGGR